MKNNKLNLWICSISFFVLFFYIVLTDGLSTLGKTLLIINPLWIVIAILCMICYWLLESVILHSFTKSMTHKFSFKSAFQVSMIGQFFNCITPFSSGGQPMQAFYMVKNGIDVGSAATALLCKFIVYQFILTLFSVLTLVFKLKFFMANIPGFAILTIVGFAIHCLVMIALLATAIFDNGLKKLASRLANFLCKYFKYTKMKQAIPHIHDQIDTFHSNILILARNVKLLLTTSLLTCLQLLLYFAISYVVYKSFGLNEVDIVTIICAQAFVSMISSSMPLPGSIGATEGSFYLFFSLFFPSPFLKIALLIWRMLTFYLPIIVGSLFITDTKQAS